MLHKWLEELFDTVQFLLLVFGLLAGFLLYWRSAYEVRCAELLLEDFLEETSKEGGFSLEEYEALLQQLYRWNEAYSLELYCHETALEPCYALLSEEVLTAYYLERNVRRDILLEDTVIVLEEEAADEMRMQEETNATILAAGAEQFLPLPKEDEVFQVEAVRKIQKVYEGEELITLCIVHSEEGTYYAEAEPMKAEQSGQIVLTVELGGRIETAEVEVICYPRRCVCEQGHTYVNSRSVLEMGSCPYCVMLPDNAECNVSTLFGPLGLPLAAEELWMTVTFRDGHTELVTPDSEEWQDDFDRNYCGMQVVTIRYRGVEEQIVVITEPSCCMECGKECTARCFEDYEAFPFCTECMSKTPLYTGKVLEFEQRITYGQIVEILDREGYFALEKEEVLTVYLKKNGVCVAGLQSTSGKDGKKE